MKSILLKKIIITLLLLFISNIIFANNYDNFSAPNYLYIDDNAHSKNNLEKDLKSILKNYQVFLYVSGCHLDGEALPPFQALTKRYPHAKFVRVSQHASTKEYMLRRYGIHGAPHLYFLHKGNIVSSMPYHFSRVGGKNKFMGWRSSINRWVSKIWPFVKHLNRYSNIYPVTSFNYQKIFRNRKAVLLRTDSTKADYGNSINVLYAAAKKYPAVIFALDSGHIPYNQEFTFKYRSAYNSFSIVANSDSIEATLRKPHNKNYNSRKVIGWISKNFGSSSKESDRGRDGAYLKKIFQRADSYKLATMNVQEFKRINKKYRVIAQLPLQQSFYVLINAITDSRRDPETAKALIKELRYDSKGGFKKAVKNAIIRRKVYTPVIERIISYETDGYIKRKLVEIKELYDK